MVSIGFQIREARKRLQSLVLFIDRMVTNCLARGAYEVFDASLLYYQTRLKNARKNFFVLTMSGVKSYNKANI